MATTDDENPLKLSNQLCFALYATSRAFTKKYGALLDDLGVTYPQYLSLMALWESDGLSVQELASQLEVEGATATPIVQRLEKLGLVDRKRDTQDERRVCIHLTTKGKAVRKKALHVPPAIGCAVNISDKDANSMIAKLDTIRKNLK